MDERMLPLIEEYMSLAASLAQQVWRTAPHALELDELKGIANFGLVDAANKWYPYCEKNGYSPDAVEYFRPFVVRRVHGALIDAIRAADWATRSLRTKAKALQEAGADRGASERELVERTGLSVGEIRATRQGMARRPVSLELEETEVVSGQDVVSTTVVSLILAHATVVIRQLEPEQQIILALHYHRGMQLQEVATVMGLVESRVSQLHAQAVLTVHAALLRAVGGSRDAV